MTGSTAMPEKQRHIEDGLYRGEDGLLYYSFRFKGKKHQGCTGLESKTRARIFLLELRGRIAKIAAGLEVSDTPSLSIAELWKAWLKDNKSTVKASHLERVTRDWELHILPALGKVLALEVTTARARQLRADYLDAPSLRNTHFRKMIEPGVERKLGKRGESGANHLMAHLHLVFGWALENALITLIPLQGSATYTPGTHPALPAPGARGTLPGIPGSSCHQRRHH